MPHSRRKRNSSPEVVLKTAHLLEKQWILPSPPEGEQADRLCRGLDVPFSFAGLLLARGLATPTAAEAFLSPKLRALSDPFRLPAMREAVETILEAIDQRRRIVLYGDYDVDGITSLALLSRFLLQYGAEAACFLPSRIEEGYGLTVEGAERCLETHRPELLIALDCGTTSIAEIALLREQGVDVVVVDHHESRELPDALAIVNPKRPDAVHEEDRNLCTVGLVFKLCHALLKTRPCTGLDLKEFLDLVALGTVADIVPLVGENRILVQRGLKQLGRSRWCGVEALMEVARVDAPVSATEVGYQLGPRLNAAGRLGTAETALRLLLTDEPGLARKLAVELDIQNRERQQVEQTTLAEAEAQIDPECLGNAIVLAGEGWHPGVLGIVASRISRRFHRPTWVIGFDEDGIGKGSGRSVEGVALTTLLEPCAPLLERYGGHEMAAGLTLEKARFPAFQERFTTAVEALLAGRPLRATVRPVQEIPFPKLDLTFHHFHETLQPFGMGNPQPLLVARGISLAAPPRVLKEKHLKLLLSGEGGRFEAVFFNHLPEDLPPPPWDVAYKIGSRLWQGRLQIMIEAIRSADA